MSRLRIRIPRLVLDGATPDQRSAIAGALARETAAAIGRSGAAGPEPPRAASGGAKEVLTAQQPTPAAVGHALARHVVRRIGS
jgi:hypothetical protein